MSYRWSILAVAALAIGGAAWYFGRPQAPKEEPVPADYGLGPHAQIEKPSEPPPKVIEVIDLARAYEPIHEPEQLSVGGIDPARFIEVSTAPRTIPPAFVDEDDTPFADVIRTVEENDTGSFLLNDATDQERISVMPREVSGPGPKPVKLDVMPREVN